MESVDLVSVVLRAAAFIAMLQAAGLALFAAAVTSRVSPAALPPARSILQAASLAIALLLTYRLMDAARMAGEWRGIVDGRLQALVWGRPPGVSSLVAVAGLLGIGGGAGVPGRWGVRLGVSGACLVAASFTLTGHTTVATHRGVLAGLLVLHVGLAAYWIGAVAGLYRLTRSGAPSQVASAAERFSAGAVGLIPLIPLAGGLMIWGLLQHLSDLRTPYGALLLAKAAGFSGLMLLAARNRLRIVPGLRVGAAASLGEFRRVLRAEYALLCGVLAVTATMTALFSWQ